MQTKREFEASLRVLRALKKPTSATIVLSWDEDMQRAYSALARGKYVRTLDTGGRSGSFRWDTIQASPEGLMYLSSIEATQRNEQKGR